MQAADSPNAHKCVVFVDLVESVQLMERHETQMVQMWQRAMNRFTNEAIAPAHGVLVKSLGDGFLAYFDSTRAAVKAAFQVLTIAGEVSAEALDTTEAQLELRCAVHDCEFAIGEFDIYGSGVNLAARLMSLAHPGQVIASSASREGLTDTVDADIEDLGDCYLKHVEQPVRAYRLTAAALSAAYGAAQLSVPRPTQAPTPGAHDMRVRVAVFPWATRLLTPEQALLGEILADEVITCMAQMSTIRVLSRLSSSAQSAEIRPTSSLKERSMGASYSVSGSIIPASNGCIRIRTELMVVASEEVLWSDIYTLSPHELFASDWAVAAAIADKCVERLCEEEIDSASRRAIPNLDSYRVMFGAISLMHRHSVGDSDRAKALLDSLVTRLPRNATAHSWVAQWFVVRAVQGLAAADASNEQLARQYAERALALDPRSSQALCALGSVHASLLGDIQAAIAHYQQAVACNPSDPLANLLLGNCHAFCGDGAKALAACEAAVELSPLDPMRFLFDLMSASAHIAAAMPAQAVQLASASHKRNRQHLSTYRVLAIAQAMSGDEAAARQTMAALLARDPSFNLRKFAARNPSRDLPIGQQLLHALRAAGAPE